MELEDSSFPVFLKPLRTTKTLVSAEHSNIPEGSSESIPTSSVRKSHFSQNTQFIAEICYTGEPTCPTFGRPWPLREENNMNCCDVKNSENFGESDKSVSNDPKVSDIDFLDSMPIGLESRRPQAEDKGNINIRPEKSDKKSGHSQIRDDEK